MVYVLGKRQKWLLLKEQEFGGVRQNSVIICLGSRPRICPGSETLI